MTCETCTDPCSEAEVVWTIEQGAVFSMILRVRNKKTGGAFNLTGYAVRGQLRRQRFESQTLPVATFACTVLDAAKGKVRVRLGASVTTLMFDGGYFDVEVYDPDDLDVVYRVLSGRWITTLEATT